MPLKIKEQYMCWTRRLSSRQEIQIINESKKILYVTLDDLQAVTGVDPKTYVFYPFTKNVVLVSISYYGEDREMTSLCHKLLLNPGKALQVYG